MNKEPNLPPTVLAASVHRVPAGGPDDVADRHLRRTRFALEALVSDLPGAPADPFDATIDVNGRAELLAEAGLSAPMAAKVLRADGHPASAIRLALRQPITSAPGDIESLYPAGELATVDRAIGSVPLARTGRTPVLDRWRDTAATADPEAVRMPAAQQRDVTIGME